MPISQASADVIAQFANLGLTPPLQIIVAAKANADDTSVAQDLAAFA